jgi:feruloyl esterase
MRILLGGASALVFATLMAGMMRSEPLEARTSCENLASLVLPDASITLASTVEAGTSVQMLKAPRAFCRVAATLRPSSDSDIKIEVWLPVSGWNGKFQAVGNGAFNGAIGYPALATALGRGYAAASTDTGHVGPGASFALGHPEKAVDFAWRAVHEMTVASKKIIAAYYDTGLRFSYWNGCSAGGRQAMKEAQRFPADFDGIIAGAPGLDWTGRAAQAVHVAQALQKDETARLSSAKARLLHGGVLKACDALDGVEDGVIDDPRRCKFDPGVLQCKGAENESCLTAAQVSAAKLLYSNQVNPKTKRTITGLMPGSELGWTEMGWTASARATGLDQFRFLVFKDPHWDIDRFNFNTDIVRAEETDNNTINALDPNLNPFIDRGGKLIQYHGWSDPQISPASSIQYFERVLEALGGVGKVHGSYRLFMAPGMGHCGGGEGPNSFDMVSSLEKWVEQGKAPDQIIASRSANNVVDRTRPLCPYPLVARYKGAGSTNDAANFACVSP